MAFILLTNFTVIAFASDNLASRNSNAVFTEGELFLLNKLSNTTAIENDFQRNELNKISEYNINFEVDSNYIDFHNSILITNSDAHGTRFLILPVISDEYSLLSNIVIGFDEDNNIKYYLESYMTRSNIGTFSVLTLLNGEIIRNEITDVDYIENEEILAEAEFFNSLNYNSRGLNIECLIAFFGFGSAVAGSIALMCKGACVSVIPVCVACLGAILVVSRGSLTVAVNNCWE